MKNSVIILHIKKIYRKIKLYISKFKSRHSLKIKISLWYFIFMVVIITMNIFYIQSTLKETTISNTKSALLKNTESVFTIISMLDSSASLNNKLAENELNKFSPIHFIVYNQSKTIILGNEPEDLIDIDLSINKLNKVTIHNNSYYIYDKPVCINNSDVFWLRGYVDFSQISLNYFKYYREVVIFSIILIAISLIGGYIIIQNLLKPLSKIANTSVLIAENNSLSDRLQISGNDEIAKLSVSLNKMFDTIQKTLEKEQQFTSDASHELRTPISVILSQAEYIESINHNEEISKSINTIINQSEKMSKLISELLLLTRMDHNLQELSFENINLSELLQTIIEEYDDIDLQNNIKIHSTIMPDIYFLADQTLIMRSFINIINNAITYSNPDGYIKINLFRESNKIVIKFSDNGIGIEPENISKIFERFYQVDSSRNTFESGSGLGLSMVKWIVEAHNGNIFVESEINVGSTFTIIFYANK